MFGLGINTMREPIDGQSHEPSIHTFDEHEEEEAVEGKGGGKGQGLTDLVESVFNTWGRPSTQPPHTIHTIFHTYSCSAAARSGQYKWQANM